MKYTKILCWLLLAVLMVIIFCFSAQDAQQSSEVSGGVTTVITTFLANVFHIQVEDLEGFIRKTAHFILYFLLGVVSMLAVYTQFDRTLSRRQLFAALLICLVYAASDELHQYFVPGRSCMLRDVVLDFCGSFCGGELAYLCFYKIQSRKKRRHS